MSSDNLAFLENVLGSRKILYRESKWLCSDFEDDVWYFKVTSANVGDFKIDFGIRLSNGTSLTDETNRKLLDTFKYWIIASVHADNTRGRGLAYADATAKNIIVKVLYLIDYFLLNAESFGLIYCGLQAISEDNFKQFTKLQSANKLAAEHIYRWTNTLSELLISKATNLDINFPMQLERSTGIDFSTITDDQINNNKLSIPLELIPRARCWLWENGFYRKNSGNYEYVIVTTKLSKLLYQSTTLRGASSSKPKHHILSLGDLTIGYREYPRVPVSNDDEELISFSAVNDYRTAARGLLLLRDASLSDDGLLIPPIEVVNSFLNDLPNNISSNRFVSLPSNVVLQSVKNAIEFHFKHADALIYSLGNLMQFLKASRSNLNEWERTSVSKVISTDEFLGLLHPDIRKIGVERWSVSKLENRFEALRRNVGLAELIRVYFGSVQIVLGTLMARRQVELLNLKTEWCLDDSKKYLIFEKAKSTRLLEGRREEVARPIDDIAVEMIEKIIQIQKMYLHHGFIQSLSNLFDTVSLQDPCTLVSSIVYRQSFVQNLDFFCDYFETPLQEGKRFYIRTHQLRRFFALSFFWGSGFGGMDTLRWFMGHTDPQHLYRYITENSPGEVLRHAKSQFLAETIDEHFELRELILDRFGTDDFTTLNNSEVEGYIDALISEGEVDLEPEFIEDSHGQTYRLLVVIRGKSYGR